MCKLKPLGNPVISFIYLVDTSWLVFFSKAMDSEGRLELISAADLLFGLARVAQKRCWKRH